MPISEQQLVQLIKQKGGTDQQIQQAQAMRQTNGAVPKPQGGHSINDMLNGINPMMGDAIGKMAGVMVKQGGGSGTTTASATPYQTEYAKKLADQQFPKDPQQYFTLDADGNAVPVTGAPSGAKPVPVGYTAQGQRATAGRADVSDATVPLKEAQTKQVEAGNEILDNINNNKEPGQVTPGTTFTGGGVTIPLNPPLTESESRGFAAAPIIHDFANEFLGYVNQGVLGKGDVSSAMKGMAIDSDVPFLTHPNLYGGDKSVQAAQSSMLRLKNATVFSDAGKQLTGTEKGIVFALLKTSGKTPDQIKRDIPEAIRKFDQFVQAKKGGMMGYKPTQQTPPSSSNNTDVSSMSDEELQRIING